jgi:hypothetical protein
VFRKNSAPQAFFCLTLGTRASINTILCDEAWRGTAAENDVFLLRGDFMSKLMRLLGLGMLGLALVVGVGTSGDKKDKDPVKGKTPNLPPGWKALMLSKDQTAKVHGIMADYQVKIGELDKKIGELKAQRTADMVKVLTDEQKALYLKGLTGEEAKDKKDDKDKSDKDKGDKDKKDK